MTANPTIGRLGRVSRGSSWSLKVATGTISRLLGALPWLVQNRGYEHGERPTAI